MLRIQYYDGQWKTYCIWQNKDLKEAKAICQQIIHLANKVRILKDGKVVYKCEH